jgi:hypothetical protein
MMQGKVRETSSLHYVLKTDLKPRNLTYRQKNIYLASATVVCMMLIYFLGVGKTIALYSSNKKMEASILNAEEAPKRITMLENKLQQLNSAFSVYVIDSISSQDRILELVSGFCHKNGLTLKEMPPSAVTEEADFTIETNVVIAEGNFIPLVKLLYELEYLSRIARVSSANFNSYEDNKRKKTVLSLTIYLQNIRVKDHLNITGKQQNAGD